MTFLLVLFGWIFTVCLHEFAHAIVAERGGDHTVREKGYLSLNPLKYLHPMNSVVLPVLFLLLGGIGLPGAAVYIETHRLRSKWWESAVSLSGPLTNLVLLFVLAVAARLMDGPLASAIAFLALLQASAVVLNLLPVPGLDGFGALAPHLPPEWRERVRTVSGYAFFVLFLLLFAVPAVARAFWMPVIGLAEFAGVPFELAVEGMREFRFWQR